MFTFLHKSVQLWLLGALSADPVSLRCIPITLILEHFLIFCHYQMLHAHLIFSLPNPLAWRSAISPRSPSPSY